MPKVLRQFYVGVFQLDGMNIDSIISLFQFDYMIINSIIRFQRTREADAAGENSSLTFTVCVKSVALYHFKLAYVLLRMAVKEVFETHFWKWRNKPL